MVLFLGVWLITPQSAHRGSKRAYNFSAVPFADLVNLSSAAGKGESGG